MAVTIEGTPGPPVPPPSTRTRRLSLEALQESRAARAVMGLLMLVTFGALLYLITMAFTGHYTDVVTFNSELPTGSNAVPVGAAVEYRDITVGKLASEGQAPNGQVSVKLDIYPSNVGHIPAGVEAQVAPVSIFGNQYINLVPPKTATSAHLEAGEVIPAYTAEASTSLQGTTTQIYDLLSAIHPAELDQALTAFATALSGQGKALGQAFDSGSAFFGAIAPHLSEIQSDIRLTQPVSNELAAATPNLVGTLANSSVTGQTITANAATLHSLLYSNAVAVFELNGLLDGIQTSYPILSNESAPLLSDVDRYPHLLSVTLQGLGDWAAAWASAESSPDGSKQPFISVSANLEVQSNNAAVDASLGYDNPASIAKALGPAFNPSTYTAANCPEYPGESNPYCGTGGSPDAQPVAPAPAPASASASGSGGGGTAAGSGTSGGGGAAGSSDAAPASTTASSGAASSGAASSGPGAAAPLAEEELAADDIAMALGGGRPPASPDVASVVLMPLLASMYGTPAGSVP